jgi:hypothetical protein
MEEQTLPYGDEDEYSRLPHFTYTVTLGTTTRERDDFSYDFWLLHSTFCWLADKGRSKWWRRRRFKPKRTHAQHNSLILIDPLLHKEPN